MSNWYLQSGKDSDVVLSTRIRFARNLADYRFPNRYNDEEAKQILAKIKEITPSIGYGLKFLELKDIDDLTKITLVEKHIISPDFLKNSENRAILINDDENICIMINEEDHFRMQFFASGFDIENVYNLAREVDEKIDRVIGYAFDEKFGYLTACPTNLGTGMRVSIMVHLPGLSITKNIGKVLNAVNNFGMNIRGIYGEGTESQGDIYQISNNQSLGISEETIIKNTKVITEKVIEQERAARKILAKSNIELEDRVYRAYGILSNAVKLSTEECRELLSEVKLGTDLGIIKELNDAKVAKMQIYTKPANLQKYVGKELGKYEREENGISRRIN